VPSLQSSDFELFGVSQSFFQSADTLSQRWKALQLQAHPDKFAAQGGLAQRLAMQWSVRINEGYERLKNPLKRAAYLCELQGEPIHAETNTAMPSAFLVQQMEWRESLDEAKSLEDLEKIFLDTKSAEREQLTKIEHAIDTSHNFKAAAQEVRCLMFIERFANEVDARIDQMQA